MKSNSSVTFPRCLTTTALLSLSLFAPSFAFAGKPTINDGNTRISSNENPYGFSPKALERMKASLDSGNYYNGNELADMVTLCAQKEGVPETYILPTPGSGPVLMLTAYAYAKPGLNVVTTDTGYGQLVGAFTAKGGDAKYAPLNAKLGYDFKALGKLIDANTAIVYICNPNNPTGVLADPGELRSFIMSVPENVLVFVDEAYLELADTGLKANTASPLVKIRKNLIVSRTFSKGFAMAGLRAGYGVANPEVLAKLRQYYTGGPSFIAAIAAQEALKDTAHLEMVRKNYHDVRAQMMKEFDRIGVKYAVPQGAFIYFNSGLKAADIQKHMREHQIIIGGGRAEVVTDGPAPAARAGQSTRGEWCRVSLGTKEEMDLFLGELNKLLGKS